MSELVVMNSNQVPTFRNEGLNRATREILEYDKNIRMNYFKIADELRWIKELELYKDDGFRSVSEYASQVFGYEKSTVSRMIKIAEEYLMEDGSSTVFVQEGKDFSISQLREVLALPRGEVVDLVQEGKITPDMTKYEIRDIVKAKKNSKRNDISVKEESCAGATEENKGISSSIEHELKEENRGINLRDSSNVESISSSQESMSLNSELPQNDLESTSDSSVVSNYQNSSEKPVEGSRIAENSLSDSSSDSSISSSHEEHELKASDIDFMISRLNELTGDEDEEEYPSAPYELRFYNCRKEVSESKKVEDIELSELVYDVDRTVSRELRDCFNLMKKEIKRLNHFSNLKSVRIEELEKENKKLREEIVRLTPVRKKRGRPRKNQD